MSTTPPVAPIPAVTAISTTNGVVTTVDNIINTAVMTLALNAAEAAIEADAPFLALPVVKQIFELAMKEAFKYVDMYMTEMAALAIMDAQTNAEAAAYQTAVNNLRTAVNSGDQNAITQAQQSFASTLGNLIHYDGS